MYVLVLLKKRYNPIEISDLLDELNAYLEMIGGKTKVLMSTIKKTTAQIADKTITIEPELCKGCSKCARNCPVNAIKGEIKKPFVIDQKLCIKCGACISNCPFHAIKEM